MKRNKKLIVIILCGFFIAFIAWFPWITEGEAKRRVVAAFEDSQRNISDGCGFTCEGCGVVRSSKIPFGYLVRIQFGCGMKVYPQQKDYLIFPLGILDLSIINFRLPVSPRQEVEQIDE